MPGTTPRPESDGPPACVDHAADLLRERRAPRGAICAVASRSVIISGTARQRMPAASTLRDGAGVHGVDQPAVEQPGAVVLGDRRGGGLTPTAASTLSAMPRTGASPTMGERPDDGTPASAMASRMPGHGEDRADADHRVGRREEITVGGGDGLQHAGRGLGLLGADRAPRRARPPRRAAVTQYSWKWTARRSLLVGDRPHGSRPGRRTSGCSRTPGCQRAHSASVTALSG